MNVQQRLAQIFATILTAVANWKPNTNLTNDLTDLVTVIGAASQIDPNLIPNQAVKEATATTAGMMNVASGQAAVIGSVPVSFDGVRDEVVVFAVRQYTSGGAPAGSPAASIKDMLGI